MKQKPDESDEELRRSGRNGRSPDGADDADDQRDRHDQVRLGGRFAAAANVSGFHLHFVPGSKLAKQLAAYNEPKTNFAGFYQPDAAATMTFATQGRSEVIDREIWRNSTR